MNIIGSKLLYENGFICLKRRTNFTSGLILICIFPYKNINFLMPLATWLYFSWKALFIPFWKETHGIAIANGDGKGAKLNITLFVYF